MEETIKKVDETFNVIEETFREIERSLILIEDYCCLDDDRVKFKPLHEKMEAIKRRLEYGKIQLKGIRVLSQQETLKLMNELSHMLHQDASLLGKISKEVLQIGTRFRRKEGF